MNNNDILRIIRYTFDFSDFQMIAIFKDGGLTVDRSQVSDWLKRDDDENFIPIYDKDLAAFLSGFIVMKRGKKDDAIPVPEKSLNNNQILRKIKIALSLQDDDMLNMLGKAQFRFSKHELSALFRKPEQPQYRDCKDQVLRNFLRGMQLTYRPD